MDLIERMHQSSIQSLLERWKSRKCLCCCQNNESHANCDNQRANCEMRWFPFGKTVQIKRECGHSACHRNVEMQFDTVERWITTNNEMKQSICWWRLVRRQHRRLGDHMSVSRSAIVRRSVIKYRNAITYAICHRRRRLIICKMIFTAWKRFNCCGLAVDKPSIYEFSSSLNRGSDWTGLCSSNIIQVVGNDFIAFSQLMPSFDNSGVIEPLERRCFRRAQIFAWIRFNLNATGVSLSGLCIAFGARINQHKFFEKSLIFWKYPQISQVSSFVSSQKVLRIKSKRSSKVQTQLQTKITWKANYKRKNINIDNSRRRRRRQWQLISSRDSIQIAQRRTLRANNDSICPHNPATLKSAGSSSHNWMWRTVGALSLAIITRRSHVFVAPWRGTSPLSSFRVDWWAFN